ncbi:RHH-type rel operon transcriptional repressor/antitoxin RelB [Rahnella inusitata]|nr:RHH-type rel operon transcriptional repressor/antitoxin RelB [Rahnella inusitata]
MATINARIDDEIKTQADEVFKLLDISQTQAITAFYQYIAANRKLPFAVTMQVKSWEEVEKEIINKFTWALNILLTIKDAISDNENLVGPKLLAYDRQLEEIHRRVKSDIELLDNKSPFERVLTRLHKVIAILVDFDGFGYGKAEVKVKATEYVVFVSAVGRYQDGLDDIDKECGA